MSVNLKNKKLSRRLTITEKRRKSLNFFLSILNCENDGGWLRQKKKEKRKKYFLFHCCHRSTTHIDLKPESEDYGALSDVKKIQGGWICDLVTRDYDTYLRDEEGEKWWRDIGKKFKAVFHWFFLASIWSISDERILILWHPSRRRNSFRQFLQQT